VDSTITIPTDNVTGNGANTDFSGWVSAGTCPAMTLEAGEVTFDLGTVATGTYSCDFTLRAPNKTTLNGAQATLLPTFSSSGGSTTAAAPAVLNITAGHTVSMGSGVAPTSVQSGATMVLSFSLSCGTSTTNSTGDLGLTALSITDVLPDNFTFASISTAPVSLPGALTTPAVGTSGGTITYTGDGSECLSPSLNRLVFTVTGTASANGEPDEVGEKICHTATSSFTYIDGFSSTAAPSPASPCAMVIDLDWRTAKTPGTGTMFNRGQYRAIDDTAPETYTFPGDWDGARTTSYEISVNTFPTTTGSGLSYDISDPLPCLDNVSGAQYLSNDPGVVCANPAYIPRTITVTGFTPAAGAEIELLMADGTSQTVPYVPGTGWTLPTSPAVSEIDIPPFVEEGSNHFAVIRFTVHGYAAPEAEPGRVLSNTTSVDAYLAGTTTPVKATQRQSARILVADPALYGDGALMYGSIDATGNRNTCVARVQIQGSGIEITQAPSQPIYLSYLAPEDVGAFTIPPLTVTLYGPDGRVYTVAGLSPSSQTVDYQGSDRTLVQWTIPAGTAALPGLYTINMSGFDVPLGAGCAGTFQNALTVGYGARIGFCAVNGVNVAPPAPAPGDPALDTNGSPIEGNFCGASDSFVLTATNPGFTVDKTVQGNLDAVPVGAGGTGHVSVDGGAASYEVSFRNAGASTLSDPVMYDLLPRVGDTRASSTTARGSQFAVTLTDVGALPPKLSVFYSEAANPCRPEVLTPNPGCVDDWSTTEPASLASVTALKFVYDGNVRVGESVSATYSVSTPSATAGSIAWNSVGTNVTAGASLLGAAESSLTGLQAQSAQPALTKVADRTTVDTVGQPIVFTFTVTNNTAVALSDVQVTDALVDSASSSVAPVPTCVSLISPAGSCSGSSTALVPGQSAVFTATYVTTQDDLDHGSVSDQATAIASPPTGPALSNSTDVLTVTAVQNPALALAKTAEPETVDSVGDVIDYTFTVTNTGNVTLHGLAIDETHFSGSGALSAIVCPSGSLAPGATVGCTASYPVTQADLTAGSVANTAVAVATGPLAAAVASPESSASVDVDQIASLELVKSATPAGADAYNADQPIDYSFVVTNTGNVPVTDISVIETDFTGTGTMSAIDCPATELDPTEQFTCTASYILTQDDVDSGSLSNTARATGTAPGGPVMDESTVTTPQTPNAGLTLSKAASTSFVNAAGDTVSYTFTIRNTGNVTIHDVAVDETDFDGSGEPPVVDCPSDALVPGQQLVCTAAYTITQADMNAGGVINTAVATGLDPTGAEIESAESTATVTANVAPAITLEKTSDVATFDAVDDEIEFRFLVTNTGNVSLSGVDVVEVDFAGSGTLGAIDCPATELAPTESFTCTAPYSATQDDLDAGSIVNTAQASADSPMDEPVSSENSTVTVDAVQAPLIVLEKTATPDEADAAGDAITYTFQVSNRGNVTVTGLVIAESEFSGTGGLGVPVCAQTSLAPGDDVTCEVSYALTQADVDAGDVSNTAVATASAPGAAITAAPSSATVTIDRAPALSLVKSTEVTKIFAAGQLVTYAFTITNTGNTTARDVAVHEESFSGRGAAPVVDCPAGATLLPGQTAECTASYTVVDADLDGDALVNTATATSEAPDGSIVVSDPSTARIDDVANGPATDLALTGAAFTWGAAALGTALLAAGLVMLTLRRRRRQS
jgi:uncharacterized repeat protein (TIGR01451 family)